MRSVVLACAAGCLLAGCVDHRSVAVQAASDALSCIDDPDNENAYTCSPVGHTTNTLYRLGE